MGSSQTSYCSQLDYSPNGKARKMCPVPSSSLNCIAPIIASHILDTCTSLYALHSPHLMHIISSAVSQGPISQRHPSMCFFKVDPKHAPLEPPGAAPTLVTLEEHYKAALMGEETGPQIAPDRGNATSNSIAKSLDITEELEPSRPVADGSAVIAGKHKMTVPLGSKIKMDSR